MAVQIDVAYLVSLRKAKAWTQARLAEESGCSKRTVERIERTGKCSLDSLERIAKALKVEYPGDLLCQQGSLASQANMGKQSPDIEYRKRHLSPSVADIPRQWLYSEQQWPLRPEMHYGNKLYRLKSSEASFEYRIPYFRFEGSRDKDTCEHLPHTLKRRFASAEYTFPEELDSLPIPAISHDGQKVRLDHYDIVQTGDPQYPKDLALWFSPAPVKYSECCKVARNLDKQLSSDGSRSYRDKFASPESINRDHLLPSLPNVCGVGIFLIARGSTEHAPRQIILTHQSPTQAFSAGLWCYSASGSMDWPQTEFPNPFVDVQRETEQEINFDVDLDRVRLIEFGIDTSELYVQFSFIQETDRPAEDIIYNAPDARDHAEWDDIIAIDFTPDGVVEALLNRDWEPAAAATLITLCSKQWGKSEVAKLLLQRYASTIGI